MSTNKTIKVLLDRQKAEVEDPDPKDMTQKSDNKQEQTAIPEGMLTECKPLYQKRDSDGKYQWVSEEPQDAVDAAESSETAKFALLARKRKSYDSRKKYDLDSVIIQSPHLKRCLGIALKGYPGVTTSLERLVFKAPFHPLVHRWNQIVALLDESVTEDTLARSHLQLFHNVLYEELKDAINAKIDLVKNGVITFEFLWTIFEPGTLIYGTADGKERIYQLHNSALAMDNRRGMQYLQVRVWSVDWDGEKFGQTEDYLPIYEFQGTAPIVSLGTFPLEFHPQVDELTTRLIARGKIFEKFAGYHFKAYNGVALGYGRCGMIKYNIESRIIIDCDAHNKFLPNHAVYFNPLGSATTSENKGSSAEEDSDNDDEDEYNNYDSEAEDCFIATPDSDGSDAAKVNHRPLTQRELTLAVPFVRGYAIKLKKWLWFFVDQIVDIKFNNNAFDSLVLPAQQKKLIHAFVQCQIKHKNDFDDFISGKGRGMIMLLAGPPGVGKTLTAESVAENMKVPLYMMSAGDLGLDPSDIEDTLNTVMDMVSRWKAVLLLDEADVFLEARSTHDLERNKLVSIFLRVLEYYEGTMFLTTNRIKNIDEAFHSRIHVTMNYPNLSTDSRRTIWQNFLGPSTSVSKTDLARLAEVDLNGRQIKNLLKTAQMLARSEILDTEKSATLDMRHITTVLAIERGSTWE